MGVNPTPLQVCNYFECSCPIRTRPQVVNSIPLSQFLFHCQNLYCIVNISISLSKSLSHCQHLYFIVKISISLSQSLFHCQILYFIVRISISLSGSLSHCQKLYPIVTISISKSQCIPLSHTLFHCHTPYSILAHLILLSRTPSPLRPPSLSTLSPRPHASPASVFVFLSNFLRVRQSSFQVAAVPEVIRHPRKAV